MRTVQESRTDFRKVSDTRRKVRGDAGDVLRKCRGIKHLAMVCTLGLLPLAAAAQPAEPPTELVVVAKP